MARKLSPQWGFLIDLYRADLQAATETDTEDLVKRLGKFLGEPIAGWSINSSFMEPRSPGSPATPIDLTAYLPVLQKSLSRTFRTVALERAKMDALPAVKRREAARARRRGEKYRGPVLFRELPGSQVAMDGISLGTQVYGSGLGTRKQKEPHFELEVTGPVLPVFHMLLCLALAAESTVPLRRCAQCEKVFVVLRSDSRTCGDSRCYSRLWFRGRKGRRLQRRRCEDNGWKYGARTRSRKSS